MENNPIEIIETKTPFIQEYNVGTKLRFGEHELQVICDKTIHCADCFFSGTLYDCRDICCAPSERNDTKNISFKEIKD